MPADFESRYSPEEQLLALDHEAIHHRRLDLWWNHLGLFVLALNWFNPVAWLAFRAFRADQELACDAAVAARADTDSRHDYARALVKSASRPGLIAACPLNHADQLKRRLKMMKFHKPGRLRMLGGGAAIATLGGLSLAFGSAGAVAHPHPSAPPAPRSAAGAARRGRAPRGAGNRAHRPPRMSIASVAATMSIPSGGEATTASAGRSAMSWSSPAATATGATASSKERPRRPRVPG